MLYGTIWSNNNQHNPHITETADSYAMPDMLMSVLHNLSNIQQASSSHYGIAKATMARVNSTSDPTIDSTLQNPPIKQTCQSVQIIITEHHLTFLPTLRQSNLTVASALQPTQTYLNFKHTKKLLKRISLVGRSMYNLINQSIDKSYFSDLRVRRLV